jgi:hypothetical protein
LSLPQKKQLESTFSFRFDLHEMAGSFQSRQIQISDALDLHIIQRQSSFDMNRPASVLEISLAEIAGELLPIESKE